jgi:hypothetical protein
MSSFNAVKMPSLLVVSRSIGKPVLQAFSLGRSQVSRATNISPALLGLSMSVV